MTAPDLQEWVERYGGYHRIDWPAWDRAVTCPPPRAAGVRSAGVAEARGPVMSIIKIEHAVTHDSPCGQPWPPTRLMDGWHLVRSVDGRTLWRRVSLAVEESATNTPNDT
jgi:hypothetical protein